MELAAIFSTAFVVGLSGAMMPGPMLTVAISETSRRGFWAGPVMVAGHALIELLLVAGLLLGLSILMQQQVVTGTIGIVGGIMLVWMSWGIGRDAAMGRVTTMALTAEGSKDNSVAVNSGGYIQPFKAGVVTSLSNPYWSLWWATVGAGYVILAYERGIIGITAFFSGHILSDFIWYSLISLIVHTGRAIISRQVYQIILLICAGILAFLGFYFMYDGVLRLFF